VRARAVDPVDRARRRRAEAAGCGGRVLRREAGARAHGRADGDVAVGGRDCRARRSVEGRDHGARAAEAGDVDGRGRARAGDRDRALGNYRRAGTPAATGSAAAAATATATAAGSATAAATATATA